MITIRTKLVIYCAMVLVLIVPSYIYAYAMGSGSYRIERDSINVGGTSNSSSNNFTLGSTVGEISTGLSSSTSYRMNAGYWIPEDTYISISAPTDVSLGSVSGLVGGVSNGSSTWTVTTNNAAGYTLNVIASTSPALRSLYASIPDYVPSSSDPDFTFTTPAFESRFGFTVEGSHTPARFKDNGSACNTGTSNTTDACWDGFSTTTKSIATSNTSNDPTGTATTLKYRVEIGSSALQEADSNFSASVTVTATTL